MISDLMSCVDTSGMMKDLLVKNKARDNDLVVQIAELTRQRAALSTKNDQLSRRFWHAHFKANLKSPLIKFRDENSIC